MKKDDWIVCVHHRFANYTKGKKYQLLKDVNGSVLDIINDIGERGYPSSYGFESEKLKIGEDFFKTIKITYFDTIENIREEKINSILK
jgi:hypothetical protein